MTDSPDSTTRATAAFGDLPPYNEEAAMRLLDALNDPDWEAKRMAQEPTATSRPALDVRVWWWLDDHGPKWAATRAWRFHQRRVYRRARREGFGG